MVAYLILHIPDQPRQRMMLRHKAVVGRAFGTDIWFEDPKLSRSHCTIEPDGEAWVVVDQESTNGTLVNGKRIKRCTLEEGDVIEAGNLRLEFSEGNIVEERPADPIDAASWGMGRIATNPVTSSSTVVGESIVRRPLPTPQPYLIHTGIRDMPSVPLPFTRPPAKPIVPDLEKAPSAAKWMVSIAHKLRGA